MRLPKLAIKNAEFTLTLILLLVLVGVVSYFNMPRSEDPQFDLPIALIEVIYPGVSPTDMETLVVDVVENEISAIENIKTIESQIRNGAARLTITFLYGTDAEVAFNKVKQAISAVKPQLPSDIKKLLVLKATPNSVAIMQLALWSEPADYRTMGFYAKQLEKRLEALRYVRKADVWGYPQQIVAVDVNTSLLSHYGLAVSDISRLLQGRAENITPGFIDTNTRRFNVKASGNFTQLTEIENTVILADEASVLHLSDVAKVSFSHHQPNYLAYYDNQPVIFVTVEQREKSNIFLLTEQINQELENFQQGLPDNVKLSVVFQQVESVALRVDGFFYNLAQGLLLVGLLSFLFLGWREAIVVITAIPLSFAIALGWLDFTGFGLQQMSIVGLIIALGLLVDNAIVVTESIYREKSKFASLAEASASGASKVGWAITSGTVTTMLAFLPMLMLASTTGDFIRSMPVTVVLVLIASLLIALTLTPLLASRFFSNQAQQRKTLQVYVNHFAEHSYQRALQKMMRHKFWVLSAALVTLFTIFSLFTNVGVSFFPKAEKPMLLINVNTPVNSSLTYTDQVMKEVAQAVERYPLVHNVALNVGSANPRIYYNEIPKRGMAKYGQILVLLNDGAVERVTELVDQLRQDFSQWPQATIRVKEFIQGPVTDQPIAVRLMSQSLVDLATVANDLAEHLAWLSGVVNINNAIGEANSELALTIDYEQVSIGGLDVGTVENTLKTLLTGQPTGQLIADNGEGYPVVVRLAEPSLASLADIYITNKQGQQIPLAQVVIAKLQEGKTDFYHYQKLRMAKVSADVDSGYSVHKLTAEVVTYLDNYGLPQGMHYSLGGEEESRQSSFAGLTQIMLITAIGIFAVLVLQFKSFLQPLIIFTSIPFAIAGAVLGLYLTGLSFSMMAFIGLISLFGIVVNNAIILIDTVNRNMAEQSNKLLAVLSASATRFTPILLTTLTTIAGLLPLTLFGGELWRPLGVVLIFGLCLSALSSFLFVPVLTVIFTRK